MAANPAAPPTTTTTTSSSSSSTTSSSSPPPPPPFIRLAISQSHTLPTLPSTLSALRATTRRAAATGVDLLLFPEAYLGGYPRGATFGTSVGKRDSWGREQFLSCWRESVDLGGAGGAGAGAGAGAAGGGDGTREVLEEVARDTGVFLVVGVVEREGGTMYCSVVYVCPRLGVIGKRRKVMPTGTERLIWGQGQPSSLRAVTTTIRGVKLTLAAAICWENYMPLLRQSLYSQNVNLYLAPTADARDTWLSLMRTVACEGRCFVMSANQCVTEKNLPEWINGKTVAEDPVEDEEKPGRLYRRRSIVTETGHEIALPAERKEDPEEAIIEETEEEIRIEKHHRKSSIITEHGHQIILPAAIEDARRKPENGEEEDDTSNIERPRETSFVAQDGHQIALPLGKSKDHTTKTLSNDNGEQTTNGTAPRKSQVFLTEEGHQIICPALAANKKTKKEKKEKESDRLDTAVNGGHAFQKTSAVAANGATESSPSPFACRGGSCIISPSGDVLAGPVWEMEDELIVVDVDFDDCIRGRLDLDVAGSYSRNDAFKLTVEGLDLSPPL